MASKGAGNGGTVRARGAVHHKCTVLFLLGKQGGQMGSRYSFSPRSVLWPVSKDAPMVDRDWTRRVQIPDREPLRRLLFPMLVPQFLRFHDELTTSFFASRILGRTTSSCPGVQNVRWRTK